MNNLQTPSCMNCPFCLTKIPDPNPGEKICPNCHAEFNVDDRVECVFANPGNLRLPVNGTVCRMCRLVQGGGRDSCGYCGADMFMVMQ